MQPMLRDISKLPAAIRLQILISKSKHHESKELADLYLNTYAQATDGNFKASIVYSSGTQPMQTLLKRFLTEWKNKDVCETLQDLPMSWYFTFLRHGSSLKNLPGLGRVKGGNGSKLALGGDMSFDKFVIYPAMPLQNSRALAEFKAFF